MKLNQILISLLALLILSTVATAGNYTAFEGTTDSLALGGTTVGIGFRYDKITDGAKDMVTPSGGSGDYEYVYISVPFAGTTNWDINYGGSYEICRLFSRSRNSDNVTYTTDVDCGEIDLNNISTNLSCSSNMGYYYIRCGREVGAWSTPINLTNSNVTYTEIDDIVYSAGERVYIPVLSRFENGTGTYSIRDTSVIVNANTLYNTQADNSYAVANFSLSCSDVGATYMWFFDYKKPTYAEEQTYSKAIYINPLVTLNFTSVYPTNNSVITANVGDTINFSAIPNLPNRVTGVAWYFDNGLNTTTVSSTDYFHNITLTRAGNYTVAVQLEDTNCLKTPGTYPEANWTVLVGKVVTLTGRVTDTYGNPLDAQVRIINSDYSWDSTVNVLALEDGGYYNFSNLEEGNYTILASSPGYDTDFDSIELIGGSQFNTPRVHNFELTRLASEGSLTVYVAEYDSGELLTNYTLKIKQNSSTLLVVTNGTVTTNFLGLTVGTSNPNVITGIPLGDYEVTASKANYIDTNDSTFPTTQAFNIGTFLDWTTQVYLKISPNFSDNRSLYYANFSNPSPVSGTNIDVTSNDVVGVSLDFNSTLRDRFIICFSYRQQGYPWTQQCSPTQQQGNVRVYGTIYDVVNGTTYYWLFTAEGTQNPSFRTSSNSYLFTTNGTGYGNYTIPTINISNPKVCTPVGCGAACNQNCVYQWEKGYCTISGLVKCNQSCAVCTTTTTIFIPTNATATNISFNCTNLTGKLKSGDVFHCAVCPFILILGVSWFYGLTLLFILATTYHLTKTWAVPGILALLYTSAFITLLPQPTISYLSVGIGLGVGMTIYGLFRK